MIDPSHLLPEEDPQIPLMPVRIKDGFLYRHDDTRVEKIRPWPDPASWVRDQGGEWREHRPEADISSVDHRRRPFTWQSLHEAEAWATVPAEVVRGVIDAHLLRHQWASLVLFAKVPEALELTADVPVLAAALAVSDRLQRAPVEQPYSAISKLFETPKGMRRWRAIAGWLDLPSSRAFVNVLRRVVSVPSFPVGVEHVIALRDAWGHPWGRKLLCHAEGLSRNNIDLLAAAMRVGRLNELRPALLDDAYEDGGEAGVGWHFERLASSWSVLHPTKPLPVMTCVLDLLYHLEVLREEITKKYQVDTGPRLSPSEEFPEPPIPGAPGIEPLTNPEALRAEGVALRHCVGSTSMEEAVLRCEGFGFRITEPRRATAWLVPDGKGGVKLEQLRGHLNGEVPPEVAARVEAWLDDVADQVSEAWKAAKPVWVAFDRVPAELAWATGGMPF